MLSATDTAGTVRRLLAEHGDLARNDIDDSDDLYERGLSSLAAVRVLLAIEDEFDLEVPDELIDREMFSTITEL